MHVQLLAEQGELLEQGFVEVEREHRADAGAFGPAQGLFLRKYSHT
ncbi:MAG: hypothetical protein U5K73_08485 [Halofilum sp. (in: g-proteobacteria)]|nr:hypothetical protein [Halofilum sp. (in: g-proteobacteria)]